MAKITLETGVKTYDIEDEKGNLLGTISIHPNDLNIGNRIIEGEKKIEELEKGLAEMSGDESNEEAINKITETDKAIKEQLDYIFDAPVSETVFKNLNCLNVSNGKYFIENFLDVMMPIVEQAINESVKSSEERVKKYTSQVTE